LISDILLITIITAYNAENTLAECLDNLLKQEYNSYEIIVVKD